MKIIKIIKSAICLVLLMVFNAFAAESGIEGEISAAGKLVDINGSKWKYNEFRDIKTGLYGNIKLGYDREAYFIKLKGADFGYDTQSYRIDGGMWGKFKYDLYYNEIPHNYTFDAKTFYSGAGSYTLSGPANTNAATWNSFDYAIKRKQYGGDLNLGLMKPFYVDFSVSREDRNGIKPKSVFTNSTSAFIELPEPVDYKTDTFKAEVGYAKKPFFASLSYLHSAFNNAETNLTFRQPNNGGTDITTLPPDNKYYKVAFKGAVALPLNSKFNVNLASSRTTSSSDLFRNFLASPTGAATRTAITYGSGATIFNGKVDTQNYAFVLTSHPVNFLNGKIFYKYYDKKNKSDEIPVVTAGNYHNELFDYHKNNFGVEFGFKLPYRFYLSTAYSYLKVNRERHDIPVTKDNIYSLELKWSGVDFMTAKVGYERLNRDGEHEDYDPTKPNTITTEYSEQYIKRYDAASKHHDSYKANLEFYPIDNLTFTLGYKNKKTQYEDIPLGLRSDKSQSYMIDADYALGKIARLGAYGEYERIKKYQFMRSGTNNATDVNPGNAPTDTNYNWDATTLDKSINYGLNTDIYVIPKKLALRLQYDFLRSNGNADLTYFNLTTPANAATATTGRTNENMDSTNLDDYKKRLFMVKAVYDITKPLSVSVGYAHERYKYSDDGFNNYPDTYLSGTGTNTTYLSGLYKDQSYSANVIFAAVTYRF